MPAVLLRLLPYLAMIPGAWKKIMSSKGGLEALGLGMYGGSEILGQLGAAGERGVARKGLALQEQLAGAQAKAAERLTLESRTSTKEMMGELRQERQRDREDRLMQNYAQMQQNQMNMLLRAMGGMASTSGLTGEIPTGEAPVGGGGIASILRSNL